MLQLNQHRLRIAILQLVVNSHGRLVHGVDAVLDVVVVFEHDESIVSINLNRCNLIPVALVLHNQLQLKIVQLKHVLFIGGHHLGQPVRPAVMVVP
jgi:hypothetical protein